MAVLPKTAVIVVHGIGEQHPMDTLLGFVGDGEGHKGILSADEKVHWFVNPDAVSGKTYLRRVSVDVSHLVRSGEIVIPDVKRMSSAQTIRFFEYYWAYRFRDTNWRHVAGWIRDLLSADRDGVSSDALRGTAARQRRNARLILATLAWLAVLVAAISWRFELPDWGTGAMPLVGAEVTLILLYLISINELGLMTIAKAAAALTALAFLFAVVLTVEPNNIGWSGGILAGSGLGTLLVVGLLIWQRRRGARRAKQAWKKSRSAEAESTSPGPEPSTAKTGWATYLIASLAAVALVLGVWDALEPSGRAITAVAPTIIAASAFILGGAGLRGVGDAARYLSNKPDDISEREAIRVGLIEMLRRLHTDIDATNGRFEYDKVIVVGHSLGSVIALDALQAYWAEVSRSIPFPVAGPAVKSTQSSPPPDEMWGKQRDDASRLSVVEAVDGIARSMYEASRTKAPAPAAEWRAAQRNLQALVRYPQSNSPGSAARWIVTDLITVGSPLAHAELLLAEGRDDLDMRISRRLIPSNPPQMQATSTHTMRYLVRSNRPPRHSTRINHAAVFGPTSWTNIYFNHDLVGGKLAPLFGAGIEDIKLGDLSPHPANFISRYPHSSYWPGRRDLPETKPLNSGDPPPISTTAAAQPSVGAPPTSLESLQSQILKVLPVLRLYGSQEQLDAFRSEFETIGERTDRAHASVELGLLEKTTDCNSRSYGKRWLWAGRPPWLSASGAQEVATLAQRVGLSVVFGARPRREPDDEEGAGESLTESEV